jgi:hypothetical protein
MNEACAHCLLDLSHYPPLADGECPNCGRKARVEDTERVASPVAPIGPGASYALFTRFWTTVRDVIFNPSVFFARQGDALVAEGGLSSALAFAVIVQWIASFFNFLWHAAFGLVVQSRLADLFRVAGDVAQTGPRVAETIEELRMRAVEFLFGAGAIVLTPFTTLLKLAFTALIVHAAVRFFMHEDQARPQRYTTTLKVLSYATAPWLLCVIPGFGLVLGWLLALVSAVIGLREVYRTTTGRALLAVVFPELLFFAFLLGVALLALFLAFNAFRMFT